MKSESTVVNLHFAVIRAQIKIGNPLIVGGFTRPLLNSCTQKLRFGAVNV